MSISKIQIEAILKLSAPKRYSHFIKKVVGWKKAWGLYDDGWAMSETNEGEAVLPLWPEKEYAQLCVSGEWSSYQPKAIRIDDIFEEVIPTLKENDILPGIFYTLDGGSINATLDELENDLKQELSKYT